jgi:hypothetical protein
MSDYTDTTEVLDQESVHGHRTKKSWYANKQVEEEFVTNSSIFHKPLIRMQGEHKLLWAVFERALSDLLDSNSLIATEATGWFNTPFNDDPEITSFQFIAMLFGFDPDLLRTKAFEYADRKKG